jgi:hypothetical protein
MSYVPRHARKSSLVAIIDWVIKALTGETCA